MATHESASPIAAERKVETGPTSKPTHLISIKNRKHVFAERSVGVQDIDPTQSPSAYSTTSFTSLMRTTWLLVPLTLSGLTGCETIAPALSDSESVEADEREIELIEAPPPVQSSISSFLDLLPLGSELEGLELEMDEDRQIFEAEFEVPDGAEYEVEFDAEGKILEIESEEDDDDGDEAAEE